MSIVCFGRNVLHVDSVTIMQYQFMLMSVVNMVALALESFCVWVLFFVYTDSVYRHC